MGVEDLFLGELESRDARILCKSVCKVTLERDVPGMLCCGAACAQYLTVLCCTVLTESWWNATFAEG